MKAVHLLAIIGGAAGAYWLLTRNAQSSDKAPVVNLVEKTLHDHAGEDSPMVHAFEEALEKA